MAKPLRLVRATTIEVIAAVVALGSVGCSRNNPSHNAARDRAAVVDAALSTPKAPTTTPATREVTYARDVRPVLEAHCQKCHVRGGIAPFALTSFGEARDVATEIVDEVNARRMPPWGARETTECTPRFGWRNDERLSNEEIATLEAWVRQGAKEGTSTSQPQRSVAGARLGETAVLTPRDGFVFPLGTRDDVVRCFVLDPKLTRSRYMTGSDFVPGNRSIVHHAIVFAIPPGAKTPHLSLIHI